MNGFSRKRKRESDGSGAPMFDFISKYQNDPANIKIGVVDYKVSGFKIYSKDDG